jgi:aspartate aminotransferase
VIDPPLAALLEPLERYEAIRRRCARLGNRVADLSYANPYDDVAEGVKAVLAAAIEDHRALDLQYTPWGGTPLARRAVADALRRSHDLPFAFDDVVLTPGAMSALQLALRTVGRPGDEVVVPVPCWIDYPLYVVAAGLVPVLVPLTEGTFDLDPDRMAAAVTARTCALVLAHPGNPTGRSHRPEDLDALGAILGDAEARLGCRPTLIADETHRDYVTGRYRTMARSWPSTLLAYSFGKYHFLQGQRLGYLAVSPTHPDRHDVRSELIRWARVGAAVPTALMQRALPALLGLRHDLTWLEERRTRTVHELRRAGLEVATQDATFFVYVRIPDGRDDFEFTAELAAKGVLVLPAPVFHHRGWFRVSLTASDAMLERALDVLRERLPV